jgi:hypothetical protein
MLGQADDGVGAEPVAEAIDELRQALRLAAVVGEADRRLRWHQGIDDERPQRHYLDAEAGIEAVQLFTEQPPQVVGPACRPAGADGQPLDRPVGAEGRELEPPRPLVRGFEAGAEIY